MDPLHPVGDEGAKLLACLPALQAAAEAITRCRALHIAQRREAAAEQLRLTQWEEDLQRGQALLDELWDDFLKQQEGSSQLECQLQEQARALEARERAVAEREARLLGGSRPRTASRPGDGSELP
eukprot:EG_transcript_27687